MDNSSIQLFTNELFGNVRVLEIEGNLWFIGSDVASCLGYKYPANAVQDHVDPRDKMGGQNTHPSYLNITDSLGRSQSPIWINESGLYSLIFSSKLPAATEFRYWVTSEVLPSMRKIGFNNALQLLQQEVSKLQNENNDLHHQIDTFNALCEDKFIEIHF